MATPDWLTYANQGATRNQPLDPRLVGALGFLPELGITAQVFSGGQPAAGASDQRVGSTRHDHGLAGDVVFFKDGRQLDWSNPSDLPYFSEIVRRGKAAGITGFGAGPSYMRQGSMHIGYGAPAVWGAGGSSANAPEWLREAYGAPATGGGNVTVSTSGGQGMGLLDFQNEQPQPFGQRLKESWRSGDLMDRLAVAFNAMRLNPDPTIAQIAGNRMTQRGDQKAQEKTANRTAAWLSSLGRQDLVDAMMSGGLDPKAATQIALTPAEPPADDRTAMVKNYEYWLSQGYAPEKAAEMARAGAGGSTTVVNTGAGDKKFDEGFATADAETLGSVYSAGLAATRNIGRIDQLERFLATAPQGMQGGFTAMAADIGLNLGEGVDELQAARAIINSLVPEQRPAGSGTMSDADLVLFKQSLPAILNQAGGNAYILQTMRGIAQYDAEGANIVQRLRAGEIDRPTAFKLLMERKNPLSDFKAPAAQPSAGKAPPVVIDGVTIERLP